MTNVTTANDATTANPPTNQKRYGRKVVCNVVLPKRWSKEDREAAAKAIEEIVAGNVDAAWAFLQAHPIGSRGHSQRATDAQALARYVVIADYLRRGDHITIVYGPTYRGTRAFDGTLPMSPEEARAAGLKEGYKMVTLSERAIREALVNDPRNSGGSRFPWQVVQAVLAKVDPVAAEAARTVSKKRIATMTKNKMARQAAQAAAHAA